MLRDHKDLPALVALACLSLLFRLPPLVNASGLNSDVAVVGLQARHLLAGEWYPFLWGSGYQSSVDAAVAAVFFAVLGAKPWVLIFSALCMHTLLTLLAYAMLVRATGDRFRAVSLTCMLVFTTAAVHSYAVNPPREASLLLVFVSLWASTRVQGSRRPERWSVLSLVSSGAACFADPYAMLMAPFCVLLVLGEVLVLHPSNARKLAIWSFVPALAVGLGPSFWLQHSAGATRGKMGLSLDVFAHNFELLLHTCGPWWLGLTTYAATEAMDYAPWHAPFAAKAVSIAGSVALCLLFGGSMAMVARTVIRAPATWKTSLSLRLSVAGMLGVWATLAAFLFSVMVMDHFSMRYLAAATLWLPFALLPVAARKTNEPSLPHAAFLPLLFAHLVATAMSGWVSFMPYVSGPLPVRAAMGSGDEERNLETLLAARGIASAMADYWASYRLTFLWEERVVVIPTHAAEDRYGPHRASYARALRTAYIHDARRSRESVAGAEANAALQGRICDRATTGPFTVFVVEPRAQASVPSP
jgi:hypothetical protein